MASQPNVLFVMTDQHRGDCVGADPASPRDADGYPLVHTPNVDSLLAEGALFSRAYTPAPSCIPARRSLLTGLTPFTNGAPGWVTTPWDFEHTLPEELRKAGYQTGLAGKVHSIPHRSNVGFEWLAQHEALSAHPDDDYADWLAEQGSGLYDEISHGLGRNSWDPRPWHLDEHLHPTVWTTDRALDFLDRRDPTRPFFLNVSYVRPHTPLDPPQVYWDMYVDRDLPDPAMGDWTDDVYGDLIPEYPASQAWLADLSPTIVRRARAGYYGLITQIDHQLKRILRALEVGGELDDTFVIFCSDHGEMLGDHYLWRKTYGYEGSARVPMIVRFHEDYDGDRQVVVDRPVGLEDVLPTLLDVADAPIPDSVEGRSLFDLLSDPNREDWRAFYHGENSPGSYHPENGTQFVVGERWKLIWNPVTGEELLFDLLDDPGETRDLSADPDCADAYDRAKRALVGRLDGRPEGFVEDGRLSTVEPGEDPEAVGDVDDCK